MPHHKNHEKLEKIKDAISNHKGLSEDEKSNAFKHIEEWYEQDKAFGVFIGELANISQKIKPILEELGLV
jgi:hypothetical protein